MIERGGPTPPPYHPTTHQRGTGPNLTRMSRALRHIPAGTPTDPSLPLGPILEGALDQGLHQNPHHILRVDPSPDLVLSQGTEEQHQNHQEEQLLS